MTTIATITDRIVAAKRATLDLLNDPGFKAIDQQDYSESVGLTVHDAWMAFIKLSDYLGEKSLVDRDRIDTLTGGKND